MNPHLTMAVVRANQQELLRGAGQYRAGKLVGRPSRIARLVRAVPTISFVRRRSGLTAKVPAVMDA